MSWAERLPGDQQLKTCSLFKRNNIAGGGTTFSPLCWIGVFQPQTAWITRRGAKRSNFSCLSCKSWLWPWVSINVGHWKQFIYTGVPSDKLSPSFSSLLHHIEAKQWKVLNRICCCRNSSWQWPTWENVFMLKFPSKGLICPINTDYFSIFSCFQEACVFKPCWNIAKPPLINHGHAWCLSKSFLALLTSLI